LFVLAAAGILPLALMGGLAIRALVGQQRSQGQRVGVELARSVATSVDAELRSAVAVLQSLATALALDRDDLDGFRERAERVLALEPHWAAISLSGPDGAPLVDTRVAPGLSIPPVAERRSLDEVVRTRKPVVGGLARSPQGPWTFAVRVPVIRNGSLRYVLSGLIEPEEIREVLTRHRVPSDWVISIVDRNGLRVARSIAHEENVGGRLSESVQDVVSQGGERGFGVSYSLEGRRIDTPYSRVDTGRWTAVLGIPTSAVEAAVARSLAVYGGGLLLSIGLGTAAALWIARSINRPMAELRDAAQAFGRHSRPAQPETSIEEIREVGVALSVAADELARGELERETLLRNERAARETAETADRAKEEFMAVLSHELRTPLNAVYGWARMLNSGELTGEAAVARALDAIVRNADAQVQLIDDLLDVSRIVTGKLRLDVSAVDLEAVVKGALDAVRPAADAKSIRVQTVLDPRAGPVRGDPARLQQVAWNLLMNAVKFTPRGGRVQLHLQRMNSHVEIVVSDSGEGIEAQVLPHVFERFRQADSSTTRAHGGLGLGLALVRHLVELHGGSVVAKSAGKGQGATFVVTLPVSIAEAAPVPGPQPVGPGRAGAPGTVRLDGLRVLVTDDDVEALALAEAILTRAGAEVRTSATAAEALEQVPRWRPDALVSDIEMPGEDGYSLIRRLRALPEAEGGRTPAVALTAYGRTQDRTRSLAAGYNMHVPKPVDPGELTAIVGSVAGPSRAARSS
jgi:signal transduction histidine kinase/ActR/RegA family two-component response regulator